MNIFDTSVDKAARPNHHKAAITPCYLVASQVKRTRCSEANQITNVRNA